MFIPDKDSLEEEIKVFLQEKVRKSFEVNGLNYDEDMVQLSSVDFWDHWPGTSEEAISIYSTGLAHYLTEGIRALLNNAKARKISPQ